MNLDVIPKTFGLILATHNQNADFLLFAFQNRTNTVQIEPHTFFPDYFFAFSSNASKFCSKYTITYLK